MNHIHEKHSLESSIRGMYPQDAETLVDHAADIKTAIAKYCSDEESLSMLDGQASESELANFADTPIRAAKALQGVLKEVARLEEDTCQPLYLHRVLNDRKTLIDSLMAKPRYFAEVKEIIATGFPTEDEDCGIVTQGPIHAKGLCPHHFLPVYYTAFIAYKPTKGGYVLGLSKLARIVIALAARPVLQEQLTADIADVLYRHKQSSVPSAQAITVKPTESRPCIDSDGSALQLIGEHTCMSCRGVRSNARTLTTVLRGAFSKDLHLKSEFYSAIEAIRQTRNG